MSIEVRVPTILRAHTGGQKVVAGTGDTVAELLADLDGRYPGLRARLVTDDGELHKFVNVYINDEDVRWFLGAFEDVVAQMHKFPGPAWDVLADIGRMAVTSRAR